MTEVMTKLREYRYRAVLFINKFEAYIFPALKFLAAMVVFCIINAKFGYMTKIAKFPLAIIMALFCSFMPSNMIIIIAALLTMLHAYAISAEFALVLGVIYAIMFLLYFRFSPRDSVAAILTPICFVFKIPYVVPMSFGLVGTPASAISVGCGTVIFYVLKYMSQAADAFRESSEKNVDMLERLKALLEGLLKNREMLVCALAFALTVLVVYFIRRMSINYSWTIAMATGALADILIILVGDIMYHTDISIVGLIFGTILACIVVRIIQFCVFDIDYSRTEKVQFEDDDYYYYVKAVPKIKAPELEEDDDDDDDDEDDNSNASASVASLPTRRKKAAPQKPKKEKKPVNKVASSGRSQGASRGASSAERSARERIREAVKEEAASTEAPSRERAAYEARQAEIQRRREAARKRNERLKSEQAEASNPSADIVQEEDNDLGLGRRMAYQRRKLEERLNNNNDGQ